VGVGEGCKKKYAPTILVIDHLNAKISVL